MDATSWNVFNGPYTIIDKQSSGAVIGGCGPVMQNLPFLDALLVYDGGDGNDVTLELQRNDISFASVGATATRSPRARPSKAWAMPIRSGAPSP
jgi:hypothetical protein